MNIVKGAKVAFLLIFYMKIINFLHKFLCLDRPQDFTEPNPTTLMIFLAIIFFVFHTNNPAIKGHSNSTSPYDELSSFMVSEISSIPIFLDPSPKYVNNMVVPTLLSCDHHDHVDENMLIEGSNILDDRDKEFSPPLLLLEYKNIHAEDEAARLIQREKHVVENELMISSGALHDEIDYDYNGENEFYPLRDCQKSITIYDHGDINGEEMDEYSIYDTCQCGYEGDSEDNGHSKHDGLKRIIEEFIAANKRVWREDLIQEKSL